MLTSAALPAGHHVLSARAQTELLATEAGLLTGELYQLPSREFLPPGLYQSTCTSTALKYLGANVTEVSGSGIAFDPDQSRRATIGEFCERYSAAFQTPDQMIRATYHELQARGLAALPPEQLALYAPWQYEQPGFAYQRLTPDTCLAWVKTQCLFSGSSLLVPAFSVYLPHSNFFDNRQNFMQNTSTGLAAGPTLAAAVESGFLECLERDAFCRFWYQQATAAGWRTYSPEFIIRSFPDSARIRQLYANPRVQLKVFDLAAYASAETMVVFLTYRYKGHDYLSIGSASRFGREAALIKAALEAYQGVDYGLHLLRQHAQWQSNDADYANVNDFHKHFAFYNKFPDLRQQVPVLREALSPAACTDAFPPQAPPVRHLRDAPRAGWDTVLYKELTTPDVAALGYAVCRVLVPGTAYLTGRHDAPFLGAPALAALPEPFTVLPHPFP
ncbi:hypothetical protein E5K00_13885 [Hymenobacter aquaticus]|uniref:YcaO domain-containing protein n=1 Tax=Hymenobacter aquaticus TaxID=1867101 RepID=A0A4Z0PV51_9BACT|nr:YcaO-like family protein [Hymenobacter aquaticus]TGE21375.1 hypothetical protein E5K00_13885 [Hymenobacter aquaticus]